MWNPQDGVENNSNIPGGTTNELDYDGNILISTVDGITDSVTINGNTLLIKNPGVSNSNSTPINTVIASLFSEIPPNPTINTMIYDGNTLLSNVNDTTTSVTIDGSTILTANPGVSNSNNTPLNNVLASIYGEIPNIQVVINQPWTPMFAGFNRSVDPSEVINVVYTIVGNLCFIQLELLIASPLTASTNTSSITGLPYPVNGRVSGIQNSTSGLTIANETCTITSSGIYPKTFTVASGNFSFSGLYSIAS